MSTILGTRDLRLTLRPNPEDKSNSLQHYTDATWADDLESRLSRSGSICFWKTCPVAWNSKKQRNITLSSTEAEMNALSDGVQENQWIKFLVEELWNEKIEPTSFHIDNKGLLEKIKNFGSNSKTKHLDIKMKWLRDLKKNNEISVILIPSEDMIADTLTKPSNTDSLNRLKERFFKSAGNKQAFITTMGIDVPTFEMLLISFSNIWDTHTIDQADFNPHISSRYFQSHWQCALAISKSQRIPNTQSLFLRTDQGAT
ncbi:hypothetical protein VP01_495g1 [Puccinia sorghi]|uniref:Reverse transcriptase Ty1/copia-type domain-containing protein n=1 Tax=Puccinia sorghi TaxID=27349 RepID=A0A0L6ULY0_9BASI|nr:hypothetical protein VP01_495g1 [Puccinia sorghi]